MPFLSVSFFLLPPEHAHYLLRTLILDTHMAANIAHHSLPFLLAFATEGEEFFFRERSVRATRAPTDGFREIYVIWRSEEPIFAIADHIVFYLFHDTSLTFFQAS